MCSLSLRQVLTVAFAFFEGRRNQVAFPSSLASLTGPQEAVSYAAASPGRASPCGFSAASVAALFRGGVSGGISADPKTK